MLENLVETLIKNVKDKVVTDEKMHEIPLEYLKTTDIPESIKHFFDQEVELWLREEEEKFSSSDRFDYDMPEVRMHIDQIFDLLKQNSRFHINKFNQLLERAIKLEMNYLIEPQRTLSQFIFKDNAVVSTIEVYDTLKYFFRYEYYKNAISDYFNTKYLHEISQDQFQELISQIDEKVFAENTFEMTLKTVKTITSMMSEATNQEINEIDVEVLTHALSDRHLETYLKLMEQLKKQKQESISLTDLENILREESLNPLKEEAKVEEKAPEETQLRMKEIEDIEESKPTVAVDSIEIGEISSQPEAEVEEEEEEEELEDETEVIEAAPSAKTGARVADEMADFVASQIKSDQPLQDLNTMFTGRTRKKIIKRLFKKKENDFGKFLSQLNETSAWKDASVLIDEEFYERGINPYSKEAIIFSDIAYVRFFPKDKYVGEQGRQ
jgi:hypothetical protein